MNEDPAICSTNVAEYEVHDPEQNAYGDWAAIAIGGRYYLFSDYDPAEDLYMSVGRVTASDINEPFKWCGHVGKGAPRPRRDVCGGAILPGYSTSDRLCQPWPLGE